MHFGGEEIFGAVDVALKYFFYPALRPGWSILQVVDPHVGPGAAASILKALMQLGIVKEEQILHRVLIPIVEHLLPFAEVIPCESESDSESESDDVKSDDENLVTDEGSRQKKHGDNDEGESEKEKQNNVVEEEVEALKWKIDSSSYAAPTIPTAQYEQIILDGYLHAPIEIVEGIVEAYGLKTNAL